MSKKRFSINKIKPSPVMPLQKLLNAQLVKQINIGAELMRIEDFRGAQSAFAKAIEIDSKNTIALSNLGASLVRTGNLSEAKQVLEYALELNPNDFNSRINIASIYQATKNHHAAISNALEAVAIDPTSALGFNNLGCAFSNVNMIEEALHAYETAQTLDPNYLEASLNVAMTLADLGRDTESNSVYANLISSIPNTRKEFKEVVQFFYSFLCLKLGRIEEGWNYYESGFNTHIPVLAARSPNRKFHIPQWKGENLEGKKLLIWREQGIGDEMLFSSCLVDLNDTNGEITLECSPRLFKIFSRTFPNFRVRIEQFNVGTGYPVFEEDFDYHIPLGSVMRILRMDINSFSNQRPFMKPDPELQLLFHERIKHVAANKRMIGICWRSGTLDPTRNKFYTSLSDWRDIFEMKDCIFINLQYGECENELLEAEKMFGIQIIRWNDVDLKSDLEKVAAIITCLDCVISAETAVSQMSGSIGIPTVLITLRSWSSLGAHDGKYPWHPRTLTCMPVDNMPASQVLPQIPRVVEQALQLK